MLLKFKSACFASISTFAAIQLCFGDTGTEHDDFRLECKPKVGCNLGSCIDVPSMLRDIDGFDENFYRKKNGYHLECRPKDGKRGGNVEFVNKDMFDSFKAEVRKEMKALNKKVRELKKGFPSKRETPIDIEASDKRSKARGSNDGALNVSPSSERCTGITYNCKCFVLMGEELMYGRGHFEKACIDKSGQLANVYSEAHYQQLATYIRQKIAKGSGHVVVHLGMKYNFQNHAPVFYNGDIADHDLTWVPGYPKDTEENDGMLMYLDMNSAEKFQGMFNFASDNPQSYGLCESDL